METLQFMLSLVLDGTCMNMNSQEYYKALADHIDKNDPDIVDKVKDFARAVRAAYRSSREHAAHMALVPMEKAEDDGVAEALNNDCAICLRALRGPRRLVRLRAETGHRRCGHFFHAHCVAEWELRHADLGSIKACPLCREPLGLALRFWEDHESLVPRF